MDILLTTQLYFKDDPYIAEDPWASRKPSLAIGLKQDGELLHGVFDLVLAIGGKADMAFCITNVRL